MNTSRVILSLALFALSVLFALWFDGSEYRIALLAFFMPPPLLLLAGVLARHAKASFWAGVLGLFWFSHGVMEAYALPDERGFAVGETILALVIVLASSWPGVGARFRRNHKPDAA